MKHRGESSRSERLRQPKTFRSKFFGLEVGGHVSQRHSKVLIQESTPDKIDSTRSCFKREIRWIPFYFFQWTEEAIQHIAEHGVTQDEFAEVVMDARVIKASRSTGLPIISGTTSTGKRLACVFEWLDEDETEILPVTAFEI